MDDGFSKAAADLEESASALQQSATDQYKEAETEYNRLNEILKKDDINAQRRELLMNKEYDAEKIRKATDKEIQEMFLANLNMQQKEMSKAEATGKAAYLASSHVPQLTNFDYTMDSTFDWANPELEGMSSSEIADKYISEAGTSRLIGSLGGNVAAAVLLNHLVCLMKI